MKRYDKPLVLCLGMDMSVHPFGPGYWVDRYERYRHPWSSAHPNEFGEALAF